MSFRFCLCLWKRLLAFQERTSKDFFSFLFAGWRVWLNLPLDSSCKASEGMELREDGSLVELKGNLGNVLGGP